jgi:ubiquinone/menaquinone biosynthesis C-methylase UbiE
MLPTKDINGRQHFNRWSATYERSLMQWLLFDRVHASVLARIPTGFVPADVLDIGCGTGRLLRRIAARWPDARLAGVDLAEGMVAKAREGIPGAAIYQAPAERLPLADGSVDLVTSTVSFHHWSDPAQGVREAARVLRPGGLFILADMSLPTRGRPLAPAQRRALFIAAGLTVRSQQSPLPFFTFTLGEKPGI